MVHYTILLDGSCSRVFRFLQLRRLKNELSYYRREGTWICFTCTIPQFSDSFFDDLSPSTACDLSSNGQDSEIVEEHNDRLSYWTETEG